jgi:hypothetical protein
VVPACKGSFDCARLSFGQSCFAQDDNPQDHSPYEYSCQAAYQKVAARRRK